MDQLKDRVALVTGGGRGIGLGIVERFLAEGAKVVIAQRSDLDNELAKNPKVAFVRTDLSKTASLTDIIPFAVSQFDRLDIIVNNAGIDFCVSLEDMEIEEWDRMLNVNLKAPVLLCKYALPVMKKQGGGSIINIGSIEGIGSNPLHSAYCASKAGIHGLTRALAVDLGKYNIRCNAIAPGWIRSDLSDEFISTQADPEKAMDALLGLHPVGRIGVPRDIGDVAVFLASENSGFVTGQTIVVDGGRTIKLPLYAT
ncbi:SDR family NAD(P)-dependent oxidoreductase [Desulforhopalus singaporensis]|uniref:Meso-butanediol dehydrogenase / (S,S)-butanediol dehydrogenase / diacetyl reductase n=1 Tax=Desulforhopalus singaporensis TaxID=91360 RepID=A0A1H0VYP8_9BACT|nr:SDR family oxidoreductase [Desulforhopalus singaporensis]SDP83637.1 meso-butanediol dehydrogenase / (S,S)-butanediol dehydrogenase / diacetyl reductase [Desulforhopalus singaporensis]